MGGFVLEGTHKHHGKILPWGGARQKPWRPAFPTRTFAWHLNVLIFSLEKEMPTKVFKPHVLALRGMFSKSALNSCSSTQWIMEGKQKNILWRKMYSDIAMLQMKTNRKHRDTFKHWEGPLRAHLQEASNPRNASSCSFRHWAEVLELY